jgi:hypothetical protein
MLLHILGAQPFQHRLKFLESEFQFPVLVSI